jgi:hypothetical protein
MCVREDVIWEDYRPPVHRVRYQPGPGEGRRRTNPLFSFFIDFFSSFFSSYCLFAIPLSYFFATFRFRGVAVASACDIHCAGAGAHYFQVVGAFSRLQLRRKPDSGRSRECGGVLSAVLHLQGERPPHAQPQNSRNTARALPLPHPTFSIPQENVIESTYVYGRAALLATIEDPRTYD